MAEFLGIQLMAELDLLELDLHGTEGAGSEEVPEGTGWDLYNAESYHSGQDMMPPATLGAVFGLTTCLSAQVREEPDDPLNYFIGGCATGAVLGARAHSYMTGTTACLGFGITAALVKIGKKEGWRLTGPPKL
ncbi:PREDICTED: NADH dehydrogenase [ubiquinone] 1 alpha subcomplex subunit 11 [Cariama cristata]|uniref:NADH dehydrogenase [ubiquinone] 1 alpha subcomplex subunit 11 n=1 Tax=Cariama cristata TaxID=54380 RepID=UPI000520BF3A|nr:PREDICTED: NADH dehydrogenase [ubiquinone] 1 alpha subcomplex subunit 11 [Cariama cristata]